MSAKKLFFVICLPLLFQIATAKEPGQTTKALQAKDDAFYQAQTNIGNSTYWNINNIAGWIAADGSSANAPDFSPGVTYPRSTATTIFQDGLVWGGIVQSSRNPIWPKLRVGGQTYRSGTIPGHIAVAGDVNNDPIPSDPALARAYRVRRDWATLTIDDPEVRRDAAEINLVDINDVTDAMAQAVLDQYALDWANWPATLGAPFEDIDGNGDYDPAIDIAGIASADQVVWLVCNDVNNDATSNFHGSPPIGIELQITMWGYKGENTPLGQLSFQRYLLINKSGNQIDSMFVARWSDPDIGNYRDDFAGCDSLLDLAYAYNGYPNDSEYNAYGIAPAACGYALLQGPVVPSPGNTAIFNLQELPDHKNLAMTSFCYFAAGDAVNDPTLGDYEGTRQWYLLLNGYYPFEDLTGLVPYTHRSGPHAGRSTKFPLNGDPLLGSGDLDGEGTNHSPGDRRIISATGPFYMMPGDSQEVIYAIVGGISDHYLTAINNMKSNLENARTLYSTLFTNIPSFVDLNEEIEYLTTSQTRVKFRAENPDAVAITLHIQHPNETPVISLSLFDDGQHDDGEAGDGIFGNSWDTVPFNNGLWIDAEVAYQAGFSYTWDNLNKNLTTGGPLVIADALVGSDHLNHDGIANPGENIRYTLEINNNGNLAFSNIRIFQVKPLTPDFVTNIEAPEGHHTIATLPGNTTYSWPFSNEMPYFQFDILDTHPGNDYISFLIQMIDDDYNIWQDTASIWVAPLEYQSSDFLMEQVSGISDGALGFRIFDPAALTGDVYEVNFNDSSQTGAARYQLRNLNSGNIIFNDQPYPDEYGHNSLSADGFFVTRGSTLPYDLLDWDSANGERWLTGVNWGASIFFGGVDLGRNFFGTGLMEGEHHSVKIVFDSTKTTNCAVYRRDMGYAYDGLGIFYGEAYDISDPENPRRINIVYAEDNDIKPADKIWNPTDDIVGGREYLFIMHSDYDSLNGGGYDDDNFGPTADVVWGIWSRLRDGYSFFQDNFDLFFYYQKGITIGNVYTFNPLDALGIKNENHAPLSFALFPNYPNPFNPSTQIRFSLAKAVDAKLTIFNVLGQRIKTLVDHQLSSGEYKIIWDGKNDSGEQVSSGIYFYRLQAGDFVQSRKMVLIR